MKRTLIEEMILAAAKAMVEAAAKYDGENAVAPTPAAKKEKTEKAATPAAKKQEAETAPAEDGDDLNNKTTKELYQMCVDAGLKVPKYGKNKQFYIAALNEANGEEAPADEQADDDEYADMSAKELFDLCRKRGIKVQPKKKADVYIAALKKADAAEAEDDDDDWGDEEDAGPEKPAAKPAKGKKAAKPKAEPEPDEDDDDDWDI